MRRFTLVVTAILLVVGGVWGVVEVRPQGATPQIKLTAAQGCYGSGCNGKDPAGLCDDGISVASQDINGMGLLELRYSRSCKANWGRFTPYTSLLPWVASMSLWARVTVWNPGGASYQTAHHSVGEGSSWSYMTDGGPKACTGVELVIVNQKGNDYRIEDEYPDGQPDSSGEWDSLGWTWGPCY